MFLKKILLFFALLCLVSCYKNHLYVQMENFGPSDLASSYVKTPDPRQKNPPFGQKILMGWNFPRSEFQLEPIVKLTVRFWNQEEKELTYKLLRRRGSTSFFFDNRSHSQEKKILTYKVEVLAKDGMVLQRWEHHFWTEKIDLTQPHPDFFTKNFENMSKKAL